MKCKNKELTVRGTEYSGITNKIKTLFLRCICTNDERGKTLSIDNGVLQFSIPFEAVEECFKGDYRKEHK